MWWFLPYFHMNQPWVYSHGCTCVPHADPPPHLHPLPIHQGHPNAPALRHPVSCIKPGLVIYFTYDYIHVSMLFSQIIPPLPSTESKSLFFTSVSLLLSLIQGYSYYLSKFYIYVLLLLVSHFSRVRLCVTP